MGATPMKQMTSSNRNVTLVVLYIDKHAAACAAMETLKNYNMTQKSKSIKKYIHPLLPARPLPPNAILA